MKSRFSFVQFLVFLAVLVLGIFHRYMLTEQHLVQIKQKKFPIISRNFLLTLHQRFKKWQKLMACVRHW